MAIKMILTDLDKTLLRSDGSISEHTKQVLKKCQQSEILVTLIHQYGKQVYSCTMDTLELLA